jgi:hypothetical protein
MKSLTLPYEEYQKDLIDMRKQGFDHAIRLISGMLRKPESERLKYLEDRLDSDAYDIAEKLGIPTPKYTESDLPF